MPATFRKADQSSPVSILVLKIQDSGVGIPEELIPKIFDRFYQINMPRTRKQQGTGIGLSLVRELVELHEGQVSVQSQAGTGTCFTIHLPLRMADVEAIAAGEQVLESSYTTIAASNAVAHEVQIAEAPESVILEADSEAPLVLIVEDNADIRLFIQQRLHPTYKTMAAADGVEGCRIAMETIPDLVVSDVMMPDMDGIELCRRLKLDEKTCHIPVILLTAKASGESKIEGLETGADDYLTKPFEARELLVRIRNLIEGRKKLREHFSHQITLQPTSLATSSLDEQFLQRTLHVIEQHMSDPNFGVEALGREVGMSRTQLFRKLKALTDHSPGDFIRIMRLKRAAELLASDSGTIAEVAFLVGFHDPSYFTKCFQKQFGQTPSEYMASTL